LALVCPAREAAYCSGNDYCSRFADEGFFFVIP
jgi:hypothetical protein